MQVVPLSEALGAELVDVDVTRPLTPAEQAELRELFRRHHLLAVRGQEVTEEDQNRFVGSFGPIHTSQATGTLAAYVTNGDERLVGVGTTELLWHNDGTYGAHPGIGTSLWAQDVETGAVPTMFTNAVRRPRAPARGAPGPHRAAARAAHEGHRRRADQPPLARRGMEPDCGTGSVCDLRPSDRVPAPAP